MNFAAMKDRFRPWLRISLLNFLIVALLGVTLRYKIAFALPFVDQKHLLHAHSHFAFTGWITQLLMVFMVAYLSQHEPGCWLRYRKILVANLVTAYGMLLTFPVEGYGLFSILFSTLSIFVSYWFAFAYWRDLNRLPAQYITHNWFKASLLFSVISSIGAFTLAFMMANKTVHQNWYLASTYFFLHFQYNGWFLFACGGIFHWLLQQRGVYIRGAKTIFWLFAAACIPAYFLSALWLPMNTLVYLLVILAAVMQMAGWAVFAWKALPQMKPLVQSWPPAAKWLMGLSAVALTMKLLLQLGSTVPVLSNLAFGFRPIVIGYLHLVLLAVISLFLLAAAVITGALHLNRLLRIGISVFVAGVFANELVLMIQGTAAMSYNNIPYTNEALFGVAVVMCAGILLVNLSQRRTSTSI